MILFLSNADTDILALRVALEDLPERFPPVRAANPAKLRSLPDLDDAQAVLVRLLGGRAAWEEPFAELREQCIRRGIPLLGFGGEAVADAELTSASTVPASTVTQAFAYLVQGGPANLANLMRFVADTVLLEGYGFEPPVVVPDHGLLFDPEPPDTRPSIGVVFYRAHVLAGNTMFVSDLCAAIERAGGRPVALFTYSLRPDAQAGQGAVGTSPVQLLRRHQVDCVVATTLAAGSLDPASLQWDAGELASLGVPVLQAICATTGSAQWESSPSGLGPIDVAMAVAVPELDGRIITVPFSFKETVDDDDALGAQITAYRTREDRTDKVADLAVRLARLRMEPPAQKKVAIVLSAYPTRRSRLGNAVGLDTPASVIGLLQAMESAGYRLERIPRSGDELMEELAAGLVYDSESASTTQLELALGRLEASRYMDWFDTLPEELKQSVQQAWGPPPGEVHVDPDSGDLVFSGIDLGGALVAVQPPRGFGENPVAIYHSPDLAPTHHYLGFYRWLDEVWGADALVHVGKHGTLEWLPGKGVGLGRGCAPDAALGSLPLVYPFVVNDPGEGAQAKRRAHAVIVDHLVPPLTRADVYDDLARLESLLDEHARIAALDPAKLPAVRREVWDCLVAAEIHRDLGIDDVDVTDSAFDDLIPEVDGYLCELKDAQIRGGLHVLGEAPEGEALVDMVLAVTRLSQGSVPSLRQVVAQSLGLDPTSGRRSEVDAIESACRGLIESCHEARWQVPSGASPEVGEVLEWVCGSLVPRLVQTSGEIDAVLSALDGGFVPPGPSGAPSRGQAHVLPTGRNFYSLDPRCVPSPLAWEVGRGLAEAVVARHVTETGRAPTHVGLVVWGTSAMRTAGDDVAQALALLGVRPLWAKESGRVEGLEVISLEELSRPRVDVTLRVSGFFRDAFPHVLGLVDEAVELVASLEDEPGEMNPIQKAGLGDPRIFGPKPGAYGSGILAVIESREWRSDDDLAEVYLAWGGWSYGRKAMGEEAAEALARRLAGMEIALKNQDNREHDIFDSDDYLQDHGGMVAAIRALTGRQPRAWFGDSSDPSRPRVRSLGEEAARVVRSRVVNPKWISAMMRHGYKGAFEMAATVDYLFGYDATAHVVEDWMYEKVTAAYVGDPEVRKFFEHSNPWALRSIAERLLEAAGRGLWQASADAISTLRLAVLEAEGWEESR